MNQTAPLKSLTRCRSCGSDQMRDLIAFGASPIADRLVAPKDANPEFEAPLTLAQCGSCGLCQIRETVDPRVLFHEDYPYYSSVSPALMSHFHKSADHLIETRGLDASHLVIEAGSNDGYMLRRFLEAGVGVLGIDPSDGPVAIARSHGVETVHDFLTIDLAQRLASEGRRADLFLANNVLAHVADTNGVVASIAALLKDDGIAVLEFPYLLDLVDNCAFDTIYHQHLLYLSLSAVAPLFERHGLYLNDAERLRIHGGSVRLTVSREEKRSARLDELLLLEEERGAATPRFFEPFLQKISDLREGLRTLLEDYRSRGLTVAGYGAAAKATTLLHHFGIGRDDLEFIVDKSAWKQGLEMPVTRIPIVSPEFLKSNPVDVLVILAWNFSNEIISENSAFIERGGTFVVPVPELTVTREQNIKVSL